ncbi:hypothetical protein K1719_014556 [Acacia pycnantha]|nr:hypothetical protein K1719_014556 [Acacia pycnantha]
MEVQFPSTLGNNVEYELLFCYSTTSFAYLNHHSTHPKVGNHSHNFVGISSSLPAESDLANQWSIRFVLILKMYSNVQVDPILLSHKEQKQRSGGDTNTDDSLSWFAAAGSNRSGTVKVLLKLFPVVCTNSTVSYISTFSLGFLNSIDRNIRFP